MLFYEEKDLSLCGLACALCSQEDCPGCKAKGCRSGIDCSVYQCATKKNLDGCYQCEEYPCEEPMLQGVRNRAFIQYARQFGKQRLLERLRNNFEKGISYHHPDSLKGDYDLLTTEAEIIRLIQTGSIDPYIKCPVYETEHFMLRLVMEEDASDLLTCYSDPNARPIFNSDCCTSNFFYDSVQDMKECIRMWLGCYVRREFVRFAIVYKASGRPVGTIEMFGRIGAYETARGILRLDIASDYERLLYLDDLLSLCVKEFFILFDVEQIVTKALPAAAARVDVLKEIGFHLYDYPGRSDYWELGLV